MKEGQARDLVVKLMGRGPWDMVESHPPSFPLPKRLLLHICCGPCASSVVMRLKYFYGVDVYGCFSNPNILPREEYTLRRDGARRVAEILDIPLLEEPYEPELWSEWIRGYEGEPEGGERCRRCYSLRLKRTVLRAQSEGYDSFSTTLSVSPHVSPLSISQAGREAVGSENPLFFWDESFRKRDGYRLSILLSKEWKLYRQNYCGCRPR